MYEDIKEYWEKIIEAGITDPFGEILKLLDILHKGSIGEAGLRTLIDMNVSPDEIIHNRSNGIPLEYILKRAVFMGRSFICTRDTLIPTEETRILVERAVNIISERQREKPEQTIIDMGTGCGNIAISIAIRTENTTVFASDISEKAVEVARRNVKRFCMEDRVNVSCGDRFEKFHGMEGSIDVIVCNPPYIPTESIRNLPSEIKDNEPHVALDAGPFGLDFFISLLDGASTFLKPGGHLLFEIGEGQEKLVSRLIRKRGGFNKVSELFWKGKVRGYMLTKQV